MKGKYVHNDKTKLKEIARSIYISPEDLPPEKKHELQLEIDELKIQTKKVIEQNKSTKKVIITLTENLEYLLKNTPKGTKLTNK